MASGELPGIPEQQKRITILEKIEGAGISPAEALEALVSEAAYVLSIRIGDKFGAAPNEEAEIRIIQEIARFGLNFHSPKELIRAKNTLSDLRGLLEDSKESLE